ncbi:MAG TPA: ATP-binding protein [Planctomycetota bacterium]|nr:ATP-binding protein [Planctomycetota bacterium]
MRDPHHWLSVKYKLALGFVGLCTLAFGVGGYLISKSAKSSLEEQILQRLEFQCQAYSTDLNAYLEMLLRRSEDFASDGYIRDHLARIGSGQLQDVGQLRKELLRHLRVNKLPLETAFSDLLVISARGDLVANLNPRNGGRSQGLSKWAIQANQSQCSQLFPGDEGISPSVFLSTPIFGLRSVEPIGRLVAEVQVGHWIADAMRTDRLGRDRTAEDVSLRLQDSQAQTLEVTPRFLNYDSPDAAAVREGRGLIVLGAPTNEKETEEARENFYRRSFPIGDTGWNAEVSIQASNALAPVSGLQNEFLLVGTLMTIASILLLYFPLQFLARPLMMLSEAATKIRQGAFSARVTVNTNDEVGDLAKSFNLMASAVQSRSEELVSNAKQLQLRQAESRAQRDRLDHVISTMRDGLVVLDEEGNVSLSNHAAGPLLEVFSSKGSLRDSLSHFPCGEGTRNPAESCADCLADLQAPMKSCVLDVGNRIYEIHATPLPIGDTGRQGRILVGRDITERIEGEEREVHQERLAVLGEVAAVMAHELNNPLASISMFSQMMQTELAEDSPLQENIDVISRNTETCKRVIRELLGYASKGGTDSGEVNVHDVIDDALRFLRPLADRHHVSLESNLKADLSCILGDEVQLRQIFVNLVMNSVQAIEGSGTVSVGSRVESGSILVQVLDTGSGIPEEKLEEIFRPFYTTKSAGEGTGLGLPTARRIAELHHGGLSMVETSEKGTCFEVRFPLSVSGKMPSPDLS